MTQDQGKYEEVDPEILDNIEPFTGETLEMAGPVSQAPSGLLTVDQARAVAEVQAAMIIARANPRDEHKAYLKIKKACQRKSLAMKAHYAYKRGGTLVEGVSIKLMTVIMQNWGNSIAGFREMSRDRDRSEVEAFAWDLETNAKFTRQFQVRHWRDTKEGGKEITAERDKYEFIAGMGQRRVRSCIEQLIPPDIIEAASDECKRTLQRGDGRSFEDQVRDMIVAFDAIGVSKEMIENYLQHKITGIVSQQFYNLIKIYNSIKDGIATREEFFNIHAQAKESTGKETSLKETPLDDSSLTKTDKEKLAEGQAKLEEKRKAEPGSIDEKTAFRGQWIHFREPGYSTYVHQNFRIIEEAGRKWPDLYREMVEKWAKLYDQPWPLVEQVQENTAQDKISQGSEGQPMGEGEKSHPDQASAISQGILKRKEEEKQENGYVRCPFNQNKAKPAKICQTCTEKDKCQPYQEYFYNNPPE